MDACRYYRQAHAIPKGTDCAPHVEDSGPAGRACFRRGTYRNRPDVVCAYPSVSGSLDFWAVADTDGAVYVGEDVDANLNFDGTPASLTAYVEMQAARTALISQWAGDPSDFPWLDYRAYPPRVRCSRLAFLGGLGYEAGCLTLPAVEHPGEGAPAPSADSFLGWYGFDFGYQWDGIINPSAEEGWGRPAFDFTPLAAHADQAWAYAPATPSRAFDVAPVQGTTTIPAGSWAYDSYGSTRNAGLPPDDIDVDNWWLLALVGADPQRGTLHPGATPPTPFGKANKLYWNPDNLKSLTFFGEAGSANLTTYLFLTILRRIYATHCKTSDIDPDFAGIPFPPGFLVDVRILAETWECKCSQTLLDAAGVSPAKVFRNNAGGKAPTTRIYLGTRFSVLYRCPFPIWRRAA